MALLVAFLSCQMTDVVYEVVTKKRRYEEVAVIITLKPAMKNSHRGIQYVHCVMHKCIMVKVGEKGKAQKVCKNTANFTKSGGKFAKVGGNETFFRNRGEITNL